MKPDLYTKIVLTIIALALVGVLLRDTGIVQVASAKTPLGETDVNIVSVSPSAFNSCVVPVRGASPIEGGIYGHQPIKVNVDNFMEFPH